MTKSITIALDAMGGDQAPHMVVAGANMARERFPGAEFLLFGDRAPIEPLLASFPALAKAARIEHTEEMVASDAKPSVALRRGRKTSMRLAIDAVRDGRADAMVSAGNTGALMAMAKVVLRTLPGIDRPAIAGIFPTRRGETVMLDLGANIECGADNLVDFALMGAFLARAVLGVVRPTVGLLNVGEEELKGHEEIRQAGAILRGAELPFDFHGFVEGDDITAGTVDVVVTDGFTGNVALKTAEGAAQLYADYLRRAIQGSWRGRLGFMLARPAFRALREKVDPRRHNGAMFVGLNGIAVKSHGGTDSLGFSNAIGVAVDTVMQGFNERISAELSHLHRVGGAAPKAATC